MGKILPGPAQSYEDYMLETYGPGTAGWQEFTRKLRLWLAEARLFSPNVLIALYPEFDSDGNRSLQPIYVELKAWCKAEGVSVIDLWEALASLARDGEVAASRFDGHPGPAAHGLIADALYNKLRTMDVLQQAN